MEKVIGKLVFLSLSLLVAYQDDGFWQHPYLAYPLVILFVILVLFGDVLLSRSK